MICQHFLPLVTLDFHTPNMDFSVQNILFCINFCFDCEHLLESFGKNQLFIKLLLYLCQKLIVQFV